MSVNMSVSVSVSVSMSGDCGAVPTWCGDGGENWFEQR